MEGNSLIVVGEAVNGGAVPVYNVKIIATFYDASGRLIGAQESLAFLPQTVPTQANPFKLQSTSGGNVADYDLTVTWDDLSVATYDRATIIREEVRQENGLVIEGDVRNDHPSTLRNILVVATFYDASGMVLEVLPGRIGQNSLDSGATTTFTVQSAEAIPYASYLVQVEGMMIR